MSESLLAISSCTPAWQENLIKGYEDDELAKQLLAELALSTENSKGYSLVNGIIRYKGRVWIGQNTLAQQHVNQALHNSGLGVHCGFLATYHMIKSLFAWLKMKQTIRLFVQECAVCQQAKVEHFKLPGLLEPLPVPTTPWTVICMDFVEGLLVSNKKDVIMVVIGKFSKYGHFLTLSHPFTTPQVAQTYMDDIYKLHGLPESIISDRD